MRMLSLLWFTMTVALLLSSCAIQVKDETVYGVVPGNLGAVADNFLTSNQQILTEAQWQAKMLSWQNAGLSTQCVSSQTVGDLKDEIEQLCTRTPCTYETAQAVKVISAGLAKVQKLGHY